jgi:hypothetical protein
MYGEYETRTREGATTEKAEMTLGSAGWTARATSVVFGIFVCLLFAGRPVEAKDDPVQWVLGAVNNTTNIKPGGHVWLELTATIQPSQHHHHSPGRESRAGFVCSLPPEAGS